MSNEIKQNIIRDLQGDVLSGDHYTINMFSCWLDGSYLGEAHYRKNLAAIKNATATAKNYVHSLLMLLQVTLHMMQLVHMGTRKKY